MMQFHLPTALYPPKPNIVNSWGENLEISKGENLEK